MSTSPVTPTPAAAGTTTSGLPTGQSLNNMFLQLLVAQLQNQDPTSPVDPSQFVGQLAQFSELSEVTSIYTLLQGLVPASSGTGGTSGIVSSSSGASSSTGVSPAAASLLAPFAMAPASLETLSSPASAAAASAATALPSFASPTLSALTSKIQGAF